MYNYTFKENDEHVLNEVADVNIKFTNRNMLVNILLTNKNVLVFYDTERDNPMKSGGMQIMPQFEVLFKIDLSNMNYKIEDEDTIININNNKVTLYNFNLKNFIEKDD